MNSIIAGDIIRYPTKRSMPKFQLFFRKASLAKNPIERLFYKALFVFYRNKYHVDMTLNTQIGAGLYFGHPYGITINPAAEIGMNVNLHKGVTIGQENRGSRQGAPRIGNCVWIGTNATVVGDVKIGNDVLIAPNSFVNRDIPDHSIVFGNPCIIKSSEDATQGYINRKC